MAVEICEMVPADAAAVAAVIAVVWPDEAATPGRIAAVAGRTDHHGWVARDSAGIAGFLDGFTTRSPDGVRRWELDLIAVHPRARGQGIARGLVMAALGHVNDVDLIRALVRVDNAPMQRVMAQTGFTGARGGPHMLLVADADASSDGGDAHALLDVHTLTYGGVWVEGAQGLAQLIRARGRAWRRGLDVAGAVIPAGNHPALQAAHTAGYARLGTYDWWVRTL